MTHHPSRRPGILALTRAGSAGAVTALAALSLALPANAQRPPEPETGFGPATSVVLTVPASVPDGGLQIIQIGAGLLAGLGLGAAAVAARRSQRPAHLPHTA